jgi:hypothetical protein
LAGRDKSFTVNIIPHDANRRRREWIVSGRKLVIFRLIIVLLALVLAASLVTITIGAREFSDYETLRSRNTELTDSLSAARELNRRLDMIQLELEEIREIRRVIENLATAGGSRENPE